jgi:hypothetical protein
VSEQEKIINLNIYQLHWWGCQIGRLQPGGFVSDVITFLALGLVEASGLLSLACIPRILSCSQDLRSETEVDNKAIKKD